MGRFDSVAQLSSGSRMGLHILWLKVLSASLLASAKARLAQGDIESARRKVERILDLYGARAVEVPVYANIMHALIAWNVRDYEITAVFVRKAADQIGLYIEKGARKERKNELHYLRAYLWTLLYHSENSGAAIVWEDFSDVTPAFDVNLTMINRTIREMFPVDQEVFTAGRAR